MYILFILPSLLPKYITLVSIPCPSTYEFSHNFISGGSNRIVSSSVFHFTKWNISLFIIHFVFHFIKWNTEENSAYFLAASCRIYFYFFPGSLAIFIIFHWKNNHLNRLCVQIERINNAFWSIHLVRSFPLFTKYY